MRPTNSPHLERMSIHLANETTFESKIGSSPSLEIDMMLAENAIIRHPEEAALLRQALAGNDQAIGKFILYLSSPNPNLRQAMRETVHDVSTPSLWQHMLCCLAIQCWDEHRESSLRVDQEALQRIDQGVVEVFSQDEYTGEGEVKEIVLHAGLDDEHAEIRYASAYLLGLRGDPEMIPLLEEVLDTAVKSWKVRAARAMGAIYDERVGPPLIKALAMDRGTLHSEARQALQNLGPVVEKAWVEALSHPNSHVRWHAARSLGNPADARSLKILAEGLLDENHEVRWATADALARIGPPAIPATLAVISRARFTTSTRQACYHALHGVLSRRLRDRLKPLLAALQSPTGSTEAPALAEQLLKEWETTQ